MFRNKLGGTNGAGAYGAQNNLNYTNAGNDTIDFLVGAMDNHD